MGCPYKFPLRKSPPCDPQRHLIYRMESESIGARDYMAMSRPNIARLIRSVCRRYRVRPIKIIYKDLGIWAAQYIDPNVIELSNWKTTSMDCITISHELAHHIHGSFGEFTDAHEAHGPQFMACHMSVMDTIRLIPVYAMRVICAEYGIKYTDPGNRGSLADLGRAVFQSTTKVRQLKIKRARLRGAV